MAYSNSKMVSYTKLSPNHSGQRTHAIDRITPHCVVGQCSVETLGNIFYPKSREASCQYGIGPDGRVGMYVEEKNRSWCSSSNANDQRAITIECASDTNAPYTMNSKVYDTLVKLCIDICKRNGKKKLVWLGNKDKSLNYTPKSDEMVITVHRWFANKSCPGDWLYSRLGDLAKRVTAGLGSTDSTPTTPSKKVYYRVRKSWNDAKSQKGAYTVLANAKACADKNAGYYVFDDTGKAVYPVAKPATFKPYLVEVKITNLIIRKGPGTSYAATNKYTGKGTFTIVDEKNGWGKLKSGIGWISLAYATKV